MPCAQRKDGTMKEFSQGSLKWIAPLTLGFSSVKMKVQSNRLCYCTLSHLATLYPFLLKDYIFQPFELNLGRWHVLVNERWVEVIWTSSRQKLYKTAEFTNLLFPLKPQWLAMFLMETDLSALVLEWRNCPRIIAYPPWNCIMSKKKPL